MSKLFNKMDRGAGKLFSKAEKDFKLMGKSGRSLASRVGGALGSAGGEVSKVASQIEKATAGTPLGAIAGRVATGAGAVQTGGKALKALGKGNVKSAVKLGEKAVAGALRVV